MIEVIGSFVLSQSVLGRLTKYKLQTHSEMDWKKTLGQVAVVVVGVLAAGYVKQLLDKSTTSAPAEA